MVATCGGLGRAPVAPGTWGAAAGVLLSLATGAAAGWLARATVGPGAGSLPWELVFVTAICLAGIPICTRAAAVLGGKDPGAVVLDELAAMPLCLLVVPPADRDWRSLLAAFVLFRVLDIGKPPPCRRAERLPAGLGIMADDWIAAGYAAAALALARRLGWL